jgi:thiamine-monophosphate kinase
LKSGSQLSTLGEFGLIDRIAKQIQPAAAVTLGIGDDAAVIEPRTGYRTLVTTDMLVEGIHFDLTYSDPYRLGRKAVAVNVSDIAAMGGNPRYFLMSLAIPPQLTLEFIDELTRGMVQRAEEFGVTLIGGDTCAAPDRLVVSITMLGEQKAGTIVTRSGAHPGDHICVTGTLGDAALGLRLLRQGERQGAAIARHLDPTPRIQTGTLLAEAHIPSAMIDLSDGLLADLNHILDQSAVGARINREAVPLSAAFRRHCSTTDDDTVSLALAGGEDYELLLTVPPEKLAELTSLMESTDTPVTTIGTITAEQGLAVIDANGMEITVTGKGYNHFT